MAGSRQHLRESPSQTAGPYVHIGCAPGVCGVPGLFPVDLGSSMVDAATPGERIAIEGHVYDGAGEPAKDAMIEIWQADHQGRYLSEQGNTGTGGFSGWGRQASDLETGLYRFETIRPGPVEQADGRVQAPHISFWIVARGINLGLNTRLYFPDEAENSSCPVLELVDAGRRQTLIAARDGNRYTFDIHLQGDRETVFFAI